MRPSILLTTTVCAAAVLVVPGVAAVAGPTGTSRTPAAVAAATAPDTQVRLITGDVVDVQRGAHAPQLSVVPRTRSGPAASLTRLTIAGHTYVIPGEARRYVDRVLDRSLFDVTALAARATAATVPVTLTLASSAKPAVPGVTITSRTSTSAQGYLTAAGARAFGAALTTRAQADSRAHRVSTSLFGATRISVPGSGVVTPAFQQYTLELRMTDPSGGPVDSAFVALTNVDDGRKFTNFLDVEDGVAKVSVPAGTYAALGEYDVFGDTTVASYLVPVDNFAVTRNNQTMVLDTRKATVVPSVHTPKPASLVQETLEWDRITAHSGVGFSTGFGTGATVHVAPAGPVTKGQLEWVTSWSLTDTPPSGQPYTYDLSYDDSGRVPADQSRTVTAAQLATLHVRYYTDEQAHLADFGRSATYPFQFGTFTELPPLATPLARTEYLSAPQAARWFATLIAAPTEDDPFQGFVDDGDRSYPSGSSGNVDWLRGPLAPGIASATPGTPFFFCSACRDKTSVGLFFDPFDDTTPGHSGSFDVPDDSTVAARFRLYRNGKLIDNVPNSTGDQVTVGTASATYRAVVTTNRGEVGYATSTHAVEDVTFVSAAGLGGRPPSTWVCPTDLRCTVLPLLMATVPLPTDLAGTMPLGANTVTFTVGHVQAAADSAISRVAFATSADGGTTYRNAPVTTLGSGRYRVTLTNAAATSNQGIGIRVSAVDAAGGKLVETVDNAYYVAQG